jgi:hypothetical protein
MATKKQISASELVDSHKPKNFKFKYIFHDDHLLFTLEDEKYDILSLDTIHNDELVQEALRASYVSHERDTVAHAKEPTELQDGIMLSKRMITKADKKLKAVLTAFFDFHQNRYMAIKFQYEKFDIIEIFMLT